MTPLGARIQPCGPVIDARPAGRLLDALEGLDDVQEVYTNAVLDEVDA